MNRPPNTARIAVRPARRDDLDAIAMLANELYRFLDHDPLCSRALLERYGFGPQPLFNVLVAEQAGEIVGYALFEDCFSTDHYAPGIYLHDIMVSPEARHSGAGRRIMAEISRTAIARGAQAVYWSVMTDNHRARNFYAGIGARDEDVRDIVLDGDALADLAAESSVDKAPVGESEAETI